MKNEVAASSIKAERLQTRASTNSDYIDDLADRMDAGDTFPAIVIFTDGKESWLADGIHRLDAAIRAKKKIGVDQRKGTRQDAVEFACGANASHGMRRTNADKRRAVKLALAEFPDRSSRAIADLCGVSNHLVEELRTPESGGNSPTCTENIEKTRVGRDGKRQPVAKEPSIAIPADTTSREEPKALPVKSEREWGDGDSLEDVQADFREYGRRCKELSKFARTILRCDGNDPTRPYCGNYSLLTLSHPILHAGRCALNDLPVGGTPSKPVLFHEEKAAELAK